LSGIERNRKMNNPTPPNQNPILKHYETWSNATPAVARTSMLTIVGVYIFSWLMDLTMYLSNIPYFTVQEFEIYRLFLSPLVSNSFFTVILLAFFYPSMASRLESGMGSGPFLTLIATISLITNIAFVGVCYTLSLLMGSQMALFYTCTGFWTILFALIVIECMKMPETPRRLLFIPIDIPSKWFPLALYGFFALLGGPSLDNLIAMGVGYGYSFGYFDSLQVSATTVAQWETSGFLSGPAQARGWISSGAALGHAAWLPVSQQDPDSGISSANSGGANGGAGGGINRGAGAASIFSSAPASAVPTENVFASTSGRTLGSNNPSSTLSKQQIAELRLQKMGGKV